jgi:phage terminase large subunit GpA-like protein
MLEQGEWIAHAEAPGHASFHIWSAYSVSPNATWGQIASEFVEANREGPEALKTWVNTTLGQTWQERGEAPDYEHLYARRETYPIGSVPEEVVVLTAGVDVQGDRFVFEVVGWNARRESWSIDKGLLFGNTANEDSWSLLDELLQRTYDGKRIAKLAIDSGYAAQMVYAWARRYPSLVMACKGMSRHTLVSTPTKVDVTIRGKTMKRGCWLWGLGEGVGKSELYGWLGLELPDKGQPFPKGFCHFPEYDKEFFKQITAEHLVKIKMRSGIPKLEWQIQPGRENHYLDCRILARAAAAVLGLDRMAPAPTVPPRTHPLPAPAPTNAPEPRQRSAGKAKGGWLTGGKPAGWLGRRR